MTAYPYQGQEYPPAQPPQSDEPAGAVDIVKDQAATVQQGATEAGQHVAGVAKDQAQNVVAEVGGQARDLLEQTRSELTDQAGAQQQRLAAGLRGLADDLGGMADHSQEQGVASDLAARHLAARTTSRPGWTPASPGHVLDELRGFARQRPGAFLAAAAVAGLLAGRLTRGVKDASGDSAGDTTPTGPAVSHSAADSATSHTTAGRGRGLGRHGRGVEHGHDVRRAGGAGRPGGAARLPRQR